MARSEIEQVLNIPKEIKIDGKTYYLKTPSIGVCILCTNKIQKIMQLLKYDFEAYKKAEEKWEKFWEALLDELLNFNTSVYSEIMQEICDIITLLVNNKNPDEINNTDITSDKIMWSLGIDEIVKLLSDVILSSDIRNFWIKLLELYPIVNLKTI